MKLTQFLRGKKINDLYFVKCPFCGGQMVYTDNEFACYECNKHGDVADFLAEKNHVSRTVALWQLNKESNDNLYKILSLAEEYYSSKLANNTYLNKRGLAYDTIKKYHLGWADGGLKIHLEKYGIDCLSLQRAGLIKTSGKDVFYNRVMFPIFDRNGRVIGFGGRKTDKNSNTPKYINSPETKVFHKKECLFGIQNLNVSSPVYIVEGYMDAISLQSHGINAVAVLGTAVGRGHAQLLRSLNISNIILALDGDAAGVKNALKGINALKGFEVQVLCNYKDSKDPDEFINKYGTEAFERLPKLMRDEFLLKSGVNPVDIL